MKQKPKMSKEFEAAFKRVLKRDYLLIAGLADFKDKKKEAEYAKKLLEFANSDKPV